MSGRSLRGSTRNNRKATDSALAQEASLRNRRREGRASSSSTQHHSRDHDDGLSSSRNGDDSSKSSSGSEDTSPLRACLIAPSRNRPSSSARAKRRKRTSTASYTSTSPFIDAAVRSAYQDVKRKRDTQREKLVGKVIKKSLVQVVEVNMTKRNQSVASGATRVTSTVEDGGDGDMKPAASKRRRNDGGASKTKSPERHKKSNNNKRYDPTQLVFPRLPSNISAVHPYFAQQICLPCNGNATTNTDDTNTAPFNLTNPTQHPNSETTIQLSYPRGENRQGIYQPLLIEGAHPPRPTGTSVIFLKSLFSVDDERSLAHVPYFGDDDKEDVVSELFDVDDRVRRYEYGPPYQEEETDGTIDAVLKLLAERDSELLELFYSYSSISDTHQKVNEIHALVSKMAGVHVEKVLERHLVCFSKEGKGKTSATIRNHNNTVGVTKRSHHKQSDGALTKNSNTAVTASYEDAIDSYRDLFCRRCFTYDCNLHGNLPKADLQLLGELALQKERDGHWNEIDKDIDTDVILTKRKTTVNKKAMIQQLTPLQQSIFERSFLMFQGNIEKIAVTIGASIESVKAFVKTNKVELSPPKHDVVASNKRKDKTTEYTSMKNYNQNWLKSIQSKEIHPSFIPCDHSEPCNEETCSCIQNAFFCTKHCGWGSKSRNFFRGCACKAGQCRTSSCACYAGKSHRYALHVILV